MTFCHLMHVWNDIDAVAKTAVFFKTSKIKLIKAVWQGSHCCSPLLPDQHAHTHFRLGVHVSPGTGIWGYKLKFAGTPFWRSVNGVHTSTASRLIHGNSLHHYDQQSFLLPEFAKVCNFIVRLRLICSFRQLNFLCRCGFITVLR